MLTAATQSPFLIQKIKECSWKNRRYIHDLLLLRRILQKQRWSFAEGQLCFLLRNKYAEEYGCMLQELKPDQYQVWLEEREVAKHNKVDQDKIQLIREQALVEEEKKEYVLWCSIKKSA